MKTGIVTVAQEAKTEQYAKRWRDSAWLFVTEVLKVTPTPQQEKVLKAVKPGAHISVRSGHGVGKSALLSWLIIWFMCTRWDARIPCTATTGGQLRDILWPEIAKWIDKLPIEYKGNLEWMTEKITWKDRRETWFAVARTARKEKPEALQGFHGDNLMFVVDEASGVPSEIFEVAEGAMTKENVISIMTGNPTRLEGEFYNSHHKDRHLWKTFAFSAEESPIVGNTYPERVAGKYGKDSDVYRVRVLGEFPLAESDTFIPLYKLEEAKLAQATGTGEVVWGVDPARFGDDESALVKRMGDIVLPPVGLRKRDTMEVAGWVARQARKELPDRIVIDTIGIGSGVFDRLKELSFPVVECNVATRAFDKNEYHRTRDELWGRLKDAVDNGLSLADDEELIGQISSVKYKIDSSGRINIETKDDLKARGVDSPDRADALCLTYYESRALFPQDW